MTSVTIAIPTSGRPDYLAMTLASIAPQARAHDAELIVVSDGAGDATREVAAAHGATVIELADGHGANAARNRAVAAGTGELIVFCDDDIVAPEGWLSAMLAGAAAYPDAGVLGGPIRPVLESGGPRHCGAEPAPITALDLGPEDRDATAVWSANMAVRAGTLAAVGPLAEQIHGRGEEEEWLERYRRTGGRIVYLAGAGIEHHRRGADAALGALALAGYRLGPSARANDVRKGVPPTLAAELRDLAGAIWHLLSRRCSYGVVFAAHAAGRIQETLAPAPAPVPAGEFGSGESGFVAGRRAVTLARLRDRWLDLRGWLRGHRLARDANRWAVPRRVLVTAVERAGEANVLDAALAELTASHHSVRVVRTEAGDRGRFENLNALIEAHLEATDDWLILIDDDVTLPPGFLDAFLFLAERFDLSIAQPAHRAYSHAAWAVTRRHGASALRETAFVEIGPLVAFHRRTFATVLPFPSLRVGWGVDAHWGALGQQHGWRLGVIDATAIEHALRPVGASYDTSAARAESAAFLATHPHISASEARRTLATHRIW